jgi:hypothetical protein
MSLPPDVIQEYTRRFMDFLVTPDIKAHLKANPGIINDAHHKMFSILLSGSFVPGTDGDKYLKLGAERLRLLRQCIDVGVDLAFMGYG